MPTDGIDVNQISHVVEIYEGSSLLTSRSASSALEFSVLTQPNKILYAVVKAGDKLYTGNYTLSVSGSNKTKFFETENNDSKGNSDILQTGIPLTANLHSKNDVDYFVFDVEKVGKLTVDFDLSSKNPSSTHKITIYDNNGKALSSKHSGSDISLETDVNKAGKFYISVSQSGTEHSDIKYSIKATSHEITRIPDGAIKGTTGDDFSDGTHSDDIFVISSGFDILDGKSGNDNLYLSTQKSSVTLKTNGLGYQVDFNKSGYQLSGFHTNLYNIEKIYFSDEIIELNLPENTIAAGEGEVLAASQAKQSSLYDPRGISKISDNDDKDTDIVSFFCNQSDAQISTINGITEIKTLNLTSGGKIDNLYISGIEKLYFLDQTVDLNSIGKSFIVPETKTLVIDKVGQEVVLTSSASKITSNANDTTLYVFENSTNFSINQVGAKHYLYELNSSSEKVRTVEISGISNIQFTDKIHAVETKYTIDLSGIPNTIKEGDSFDLTLTLTGKPSSSVTVTVAENSDLQFSKEIFDFSTNNWMTPQDLKVTVLDDADKLNENTSLSFSFSSSDQNFAEEPYIQSITIIDDDNFGSISGKIYNDFDKDAAFDYGEGGLSYWTVYLDKNNNGILDASEVSTTTSSMGTYTF